MLSRWVKVGLSSIPSFFMRKGEGDLQQTGSEGRKPCENRGRNWSDTSTCQGILGAKWSWEEARNDSFMECSVGAWHHLKLDFGCLVSRTVRKYVSVGFSYPVCSNFLWHPRETKNNNHQERELWYIAW